MRTFFELVLKWPKTVLLLLLTTTVFMANGITKLEFDNSIEAFLPTHDPTYQFYSKCKEIYGDTNKFIIMAVSHPDLFSLDAFSLMDDLIKDIEEYKEYNPEKELTRIEKFDHSTKNDSIPVATLINNFNDDAVFQRSILRKLKITKVTEHILSQKEIKKLRKKLIYSRTLKEQELVDAIISPLTMRDISGKEDTLETYSLIEKDSKGNRILPRTKEEFLDFRNKLTRNPAFLKGIYTVDPETGEITDFGMIIKFTSMKNQDPIAREIAAIIKNFKGLDIIALGVPIGVIQFTDYMQQDLFFFLPIVLVVVAIIFFFNFRSLRGVILPLFTVNMAQIWILGLMGYLGYKITPVGISLPPLMCAVGSSYAIHILNQYYTDFDMISEKGLINGLKLSMSHISLTVLLAALTTFVAFMTLAPTGIIAISEWGIFSATGVFFALLIAATFIPASLALMKHKRPAALLKKNKMLRITIIDRVISFMARLATHHNKAVLFVVAVLAIISIAGLFRIQVESDFMQYFKENDPIRINKKIIREKFVGDTGFNILIDSGKENGVKDASFLQTVEKTRMWLTSDKNPQLNIGRTDAFSDFIKTMHFAMNKDDIAYYKIPENTMDILDYLELFDGEDKNSDGRIDNFEAYVDPQFKTCNIVTRMTEKEGKKTFGTTRVAKIVDQIQQYLDVNLPAPYTYKITGFLLIDIIMSRYIVNGQMQSLFLSLIVIGIIVALLFNNVKAGLLALIPMSAAVLFNFGIMGWLGINLDMVTSVIAAITVGIGVDDTIHFLNTFKFYRESGLNINDTITKTLEVSGKAIIYTSLALIFGFIVLTVSNFKPIILFGVLMALTMMATTVGALLILPSVINLTQVNLEKSEAWYWKYLNLGKVFGLERLEPSS
ncbi:MAG: MMPL family transporter [Proteobacteria bacterium]|nr:MMPL family transporter [Pseudomonadota bacterium]